MLRDSLLPDTGEMRDRPVIQFYEGQTVDAEGETVITWNDFARIWASCEPVTGNEFEGVGKVNARITLKVTTRYRKDITELMRISWDDSFWNINAVLPNLKRTHLVLLASKVQ